MKLRRKWQFMAAGVHCSLRAFLLTAAMFFFTVLSTARAEFRFPRPEFEFGHNLPELQTPDPRGLAWEYADVAVLVLFLGVASWLALKKRSRRGLFWLAVGALVYFGFWRRGCVCAIGAVQNVALAFGDSSYAIPLTVIAFFTLPLLVALFWGRTFCAAVCPLGAVQDVVVMRPVKVPLWLGRALALIPVLYLAGAVLLAFTGAGFIICRYDPFIGFFRFGATFELLIFGGAVLLLGVFVGRPYCRFLCPYGVLLGWTSALSKRRATITPDECIKCRLCEDACPFGAIRKPVPAKAPEERRQGVRRLWGLVALLPLSILLCGWIGSRLSVPLSYVHQSVQLRAEIARENAGESPPGATLETEAFRAAGKPLAQLQQEVDKVRDELYVGGWILGALVGLVIHLRLIGYSVHRTQEGYEPDPQACLSCGRCFRYCPKELQRLKENAEPV